MGSMAKIFIVLNMLVALAFTVASLTLYAKRVHWAAVNKENVDIRNKLQEKLTQVTQEKDAKIKDLTEAADSAKAQRDEIKVKLDDATTLTSEYKKINDQLQGKLESIKDNIIKLEALLAKKDETNQRLVEEKAKAISAKNKAEKEKEFAETRAVEIMADLSEAQAELEQLAKQCASLTEKVAKYQLALSKIQEETGMDPLKSPSAGSVVVRGNVLRVDKNVGVVILNVGEKDKVERGMEFAISRGDEFVGTVRVRKIYGNMCSATIVENKQRLAIQVNDTAQTL